MTSAGDAQSPERLQTPASDRCWRDWCTRWAWLPAIASIVAYAVSLAILPAGSSLLLIVDNLGSVLAAMVAAILSLIAARRQIARRAGLSWLLLGCGLACWAYGDGFWAWSELVLGETPGVPSWSDPGYIGMVVLVIAGVALHPIARPREISRGHLLLDTSILLSAIVAVVWTVVLDPLFTHLQTDPLTQAVTVLYPLGSLASLFLLTVLMLRSAGTTTSTRLLAVGWGLIAIADSAYVVLAAGDTYATGHPADLFWFAGAVVIALAAAVDRPGPAPAVPTRDIGHAWQFAVPAFLLVLAGAVVWLHAPGETGLWPGVEQVALALAATLLVIRMALGYRDAVLIHELYVQRSQEREANRLVQEEAARLQGVILTGRELSHLLSNDLAMAVGWVDIVREDPALPRHLRAAVEDAAIGLNRAAEHLGRLQQVNRVATRETPVGPALDLERSARSAEAG